jgi:hypothetical protein
LGLMYTAFPYISARGCFQDLNPWPHGHKATALTLRQGSPVHVAPACAGSEEGSPFQFQRCNKICTSVGKRCFFPDDAAISLITSSEGRLLALTDLLDIPRDEFCSSSRPETPVSPESWTSPSTFRLKSAIAFFLTAEELVSYKSEQANYT